jgi:seryl-tRNA synthetase
MLDLKVIRANPEAVAQALARRGEQVPIGELLELDQQWRDRLGEVEQLKARRNVVSERIGKAKGRGPEAAAAIAEMKEVGERIKLLDAEVRDLEVRIGDLLLRIPNIPHSDVPDGFSEAENVEVKRWGEPTKFDFTPKAHWDLGTDLDILDFDRASKVAGARFSFVKGLGARLHRALISFMIDLHTQEHGYVEILPPYMANAASLTGTGQLPKFGEDMFKVEERDLYLIPTAEVPVTNFHRDEILDGDSLPLYYVGFSACFRSEAGSAGRDTRGLIRQHQFDKVELVKFVKPETSYEELERLVHEATEVLRRLELPYRIVKMCAGDLGFTAAMKFDPEVWMPSYGRYVEISSCSNFEDFQARRANIRFRRVQGQKTEFVHTLNGSGLAVGRTLAAVLENYQNADGSVTVPAALRPYMGGVEKITP